MMIQEKVIESVLLERDYQDTKWGQQNHTPHEWMVILMEEVGEAAKEVYENSMVNYEQEMVQVAAVAVAALENLCRSNPCSATTAATSGLGGGAGITGDIVFEYLTEDVAKKREKTGNVQIPANKRKLRFSTSKRRKKACAG